MGQDKLRAQAQRAAVVAACIFFATASLLTGAGASEAPCPAAVPSLTRSGTLEELTEHVQARAPVRIVAIGSSSTEGVGASSKDKSYPALLEVQLKTTWKLDAVRVENAGIGGETAAQTIDRLEAVIASKPDLVIWQVGTNDAVRGGDETEFRALVTRGVTAALKASVDIVLLDQQFFPGIKDLEQYRRYVRIVREVGRENGVSVFSRFTLMRAWGEQSAEELRSMLASDAFHMSDRGYACMTQSLGRALSSLVPAVPSMAAAY